MNEFNKEVALDELVRILGKGSTGGFSTQIKAAFEAQEFIYKLQLEAYEKGFQDGIKKIEIDGKDNN